MCERGLGLVPLQLEWAVLAPDTAREHSASMTDNKTHVKHKKVIRGQKTVNHKTQGKTKPSKIQQETLEMNTGNKQGRTPENQHNKNTIQQNMK